VEAMLFVSVIVGATDGHVWRHTWHHTACPPLHKNLVFI
jgi:hypothetical protein